MGGLDFSLRRRTAYSRVGFRSPFVWQSIRSYDDVSTGVILIAPYKVSHYYLQD